MKQIDGPENIRQDQPVERRRFLTKILGVLAGVGIMGGAGKLLAQTGKNTVATGGGPKQVADNDPFVGQIEMVSFNFAPTGWLLCDGSVLSISQYTVLFALIGTTYGGNGSSTFALPDLRGRVPISMGQGSGLTNRVIGQSSGEENHTLISNEMPSHTHYAQESGSNGTSASPTGNFPAVNNEGIQHYGTTANGYMNTSMMTATGGSQAHNNMQPYLCVNFIIATSGIFPTRS